jgi:hypothetical protein
MTAKERLQQLVAELTEDEAAQTIAFVEGTRAGVALTDMYGTPWGQILTGVDPAVLEPTGRPTITIPSGIPDIRWTRPQ